MLLPSQSHIRGPQSIALGLASLLTGHGHGPCGEPEAERLSQVARLMAHWVCGGLYLCKHSRTRNTIFAVPQALKSEARKPEAPIGRGEPARKEWKRAVTRRLREKHTAERGRGGARRGSRGHGNRGIGTEQPTSHDGSFTSSIL